jgi:N-acetylmuramoyl-L-alanine amidase
MDVHVMSLPAQFLWLTLCVYHEARGEPPEGQRAVVHVILNRVEKRKKSAKEIILQPFQFSWANQGKRPPIKDYTALEQCGVSVYEALQERMDGKTLYGADHYRATYVNPSWDDGMKKVAKIGKHVFYRS